MALDQENPPKIEHAMPMWLHEFFEKLYKWLRDHRVVQGLGIIISDAVGGGKLLTVDPNLLSGLKKIYTPWQAYPPSGGGAFDRKFIQGFIDGTSPSNMNLTVTIPNGEDAGTTINAWVHVSLTPDGEVSSMLIESGDTMPDTTVTDGGGEIYIRIWSGIVSDTEGLVETQALTKDLSLIQYLVDFTCSSRTFGYAVQATS